MRLHQRPSGALPAGRRPAGHAGRIGRRDAAYAGMSCSGSAAQRLSSTTSPTTIRSCARCATLGLHDVAGRCHAAVAAGAPRAGRTVWRRQVRWGVDAPATSRRGQAAGAVGAGDRLGCLGSRRWRRPCGRRRRQRAMSLLGLVAPHTRRGSRPRHGSWRAAACRSDRAPGRRRWCARRWCRCWRRRPGADAVRSIGAAPTSARAGVPAGDGAAGEVRMRMIDAMEDIATDHAAGAGRFGDVGVGRGIDGRRACARAPASSSTAARSPT